MEKVIWTDKQSEQIGSTDCSHCKTVALKCDCCRLNKKVWAPVHTDMAGILTQCTHRHACTLSNTPTHKHLLTHTSTHTRSITHMLAHWLTYPHTHLAHSLTHPLAHATTQWLLQK